MQSGKIILKTKTMIKIMFMWGSMFSGLASQGWGRGQSAPTEIFVGTMGNYEKSKGAQKKKNLNVLEPGGKS